MAPPSLSQRFQRAAVVPSVCFTLPPETEGGVLS
jgi:hypothetical protein